MFHLYLEKLGACVLGFLEVDERQQRGPASRITRMQDFVGRGFGHCLRAQVVIFIGTWMSGGSLGLKGCMRIVKPGS